MLLLLASGSETRRRMLAEAGVVFEVRPAEVDEAAAKARLVVAGVGGAEMAQALATLKASSIAPPDMLVIGSDQILEQDDGTILGKAASRDEAAEQLRALAGRTHRLHSAAVLAQGGTQVWSDCETVSLRMRPISEGFLQEYLDHEWAAVRYNVGCYRIEGRGVQLFEAIEGSYFAILGMPLIPLLGELRRRGAVSS